MGVPAEIGILAAGAYLPRARLQRAAVYAAHSWFAPGLKNLAKGERAAANWDEDAVTMAVEAARDALAERDRAEVKGLRLASTTLPFVDRLNSGVVKEALNLPDAVAALDVTGSQRAGTSALIQALHAATATGAAQLCLAAELRKARPASEAELLQGDGAAAVLVGEGDLAARFLGAHSVTVDFVDHYRSTGQDFDYEWESRWVRDEGYANLLGGAIRDGLETLGVDAGSIDRFLAPISVRGVPDSLAKRAGVRAEAVADVLSATVGHTGAAHPLLMLAAALETARAGERLLLVGFGQGADLLLFEATGRASSGEGMGFAAALARREADGNYPRFLFHRGLLELERGMRAEYDEKQPGTTLYRNRKAVLGLIGGRCTKTGTVQFPKSDISVNPNDRAIGTQEDYPLAERRARIVTFTADSLTYSPAPPLFYGMIDFEGGGRMTAEFTDCGATDIEVGREMRMMFRIKARDERRGFTKYFWKATPV
jgi:hydroxymethylglutaryl-CoA synthase